MYEIKANQTGVKLFEATCTMQTYNLYNWLRIAQSNGSTLSCEESPAQRSERTSAKRKNSESVVIGT